MKLNGNVIKLPEPVLVVLPRDGGDLVFKTAAVTYDDFDKLCPEPKPPMLMKVGEKEGTPDFADKEYLSALKLHRERRFGWTIMTSLAPTEGLVWETVVANDPATWPGALSELEKAGLTRAERNYLISKIFQANSMTADHFEEARKRFLLQREAQSRG